MKNLLFDGNASCFEVLYTKAPVCIFFYNSRDEFVDHFRVYKPKYMDANNYLITSVSILFFVSDTFEVIEKFGGLECLYVCFDDEIVKADKNGFEKLVGEIESLYNLSVFVKENLKLTLGMG